MIAAQLSPDKIFREVTLFNMKLARGVKTMRSVGEIPSGVTPKEEVYREDKMVLYRYKNPNGKKTAANKTPLLIAYALVNRPYMTDLQEDRSIVRGLLETGQDVYLIDWGYPDRSDRYLTMDDYINGYMDRCVDVLRERHGVKAVNMLGICQGGTFSLCYAAMHPEKIKNIVTMVTPVDFHTSDNLLAFWVRKIDIDLLVDTMGNISGDLLNWTFLNMKPYRMMGQKYIDMVEILDDKEKVKNFMNMEKWIFDSPDQAGEAYRQFINDFYKSNKLVAGELNFGGKEVKLSNIKMPVLNVFAQRDHLVPPSASKALKKHVGTKDYTEFSFNGGHIGIYVSGRSKREVPPSIGKWLNER
ncbi:MAG: class III poly(R)-hydroxyalkanoic acid synthase subunit PhaC [Alphaproteobacteria bacterium]|nr:class III poly(R)-hydroxyalkanoic acid synthase subunit PhaC [Alphaproteobacteria bacterium]MCK5659320.1 class III poly(R)-hydroxyalkanoic acid synthase subunit PhaC [Alphaproteobacteria bacterium]